MWLLRADQKILFTFSNPALKSALFRPVGNPTGNMLKTFEFFAILGA